MNKLKIIITAAFLTLHKHATDQTHNSFPKPFAKQHIESEALSKITPKTPCSKRKTEQMQKRHWIFIVATGNTYIIPKWRSTKQTRTCWAEDTTDCRESVYDVSTSSRCRCRRSVFWHVETYSEDGQREGELRLWPEWFLSVFANATKEGCGWESLARTC